MNYLYKIASTIGLCLGLTACTNLSSHQLLKATISSNQLHTISMPGGPPINCTNPGTTVKYSWSNNLGYPIYVEGGYVWVGESMSGVSDTAISLRDATSGDTYINTNWDHYAEPTCADCNLLHFSAGNNYFLVNEGDTINLALSCTGPYTSVPAAAAITASIDYVTSLSTGN